LEKIIKEGKTLGHLEGDTITIKKDLTKHVYRHLYSFCITKQLFDDERIQCFIFDTGFNKYIINKEQLFDFMQYYNAYFSFGSEERQIAIPLILMDIFDSYTGNQINEFDIKSFNKVIYENERYINWQKRTKNKVERVVK